MSKKKEGLLGKLSSLGINSAFLNEETIRGLLGELPLPKDVVSGFVDHAKKSKEDFFKGAREEFASYLSKLDPARLAEEVLEKFDFEVNATIKLKKKKPLRKTKAATKKK